MANPFDDINSDFEGGQRPTTDELHRREEIEKLKSNRQMREKYAERRENISPLKITVLGCCEGDGSRLKIDSKN